MKGFTLVEMLLSMACIGLLAGISLPVWNQFLTRSDRQSTTRNLVSALRRGSMYSRQVRGDSQWSVRLTSTSATLYKGTDFATRDQAFDEVITYPAPVTGTGLTDVVFTKLTGETANTGSVTLSSNNGTDTITINAKSMVTY